MIVTTITIIISTFYVLMCLHSPQSLLLRCELSDFRSEARNQPPGGVRVRPGSSRWKYCIKGNSHSKLTCRDILNHFFYERNSTKTNFGVK